MKMKIRDMIENAPYIVISKIARAELNVGDIVYREGDFLYLGAIHIDLKKHRVIDVLLDREELIHRMKIYQAQIKSAKQKIAHIKEALNG